MITIVGMGCNENSVTLEGDEAIKTADIVVVKTAKTQSYKYFENNNIEHIVLDDMFEKAENFKELDESIVAKIKELDKEDIKLCYCVDGSAHQDRSVALLIKDDNIKVITGVSRAESNAPFTSGMLQISAYDLLSEQGFNYDTRSSLVVFDIDNEYVASDIKLVLSNILGDEIKVIFNGKEIPLYELDWQKDFGYDSYLRVDPQDIFKKKRFNMCDLYWIMKRLRDVDGCPWDKVQTHESIKKNLIEEAYELAEAITNNDVDNMIEETGDVLLQAIFHACIGEDNGEYNFEDAVTGLCDKLISRHTHIFGKDKVTNPEEALKVWEKNKKIEKHQAKVSDAVNDVPKCYPALLRAQKVCKRVTKGGWGFDSFESLVEKLHEELGELKEAYDKHDEANIKEELGDTLLVLAEMGRFVKSDCEEALYDTTNKLQKRYTAYEKLVLEDKKDLLSLSQEEKDEYYLKAKKIVEKESE